MVMNDMKKYILINWKFFNDLPSILHHGSI